MMTAGIDVGGTWLRVAVFDAAHKMVDVFRTANDRDLSARENLEPLMAFLNRYARMLRGVGVGCPGPLSVREGKMLNPPNLTGWDNFEIVNYIQERTGLRAALTNDASAACLAEARLGAGRGCESVAYVGVSTGIGGGFAIHGKIYDGAHANAAEFWNMIVNEDPHCHKNASPGSLNEQASGSGLARAATERYGRETTARELFERYNRGDGIAREIVQHAADALGRGIANISCTLDPEVFVIGGSVAAYNPGYVKLALERARIYAVFPEALLARPAAFGDDAGLIGASLLIS